jgi:uncharacterized protein YndB with AHSA1/START domain
MSDVDVSSQLSDTHRQVADGRVAGSEGRAVLLRRRYEAPAEDVWDACTSRERIGRWFLPVTGDLRLGGRFQLEGNAGGEILRCEPPRLLRVTWVMGDGPPSEVELRLSPGSDDSTVLELEHTAVPDPELWGRFGPGAVGVGWDGALLGLGLHLAGGVMGDAMAWMTSPAGRDFYRRSSEAWGAAFEAYGATPEEAASAVANTTAFYAPPSPDGNQSANGG